MCVAVIVENKMNIKRKDLLAMEGDNPDGAGVAWMEDGRVLFLRGLTADQIYNVQKTLPRPFFIHFRYATRGGKSPLLTHPFPLGMDSFTAGLSGESDIGVLMHNGTWDGFRKYIPGGIDDSKVSDTQVAAYAAHVVGHEILDEVRWATATMFNDAIDGWKIEYRGTWTKYKGNLYSNLNWQTRSRPRWVPTVSTGSGYYYSGGKPYTPPSHAPSHSAYDKYDDKYDIAYQRWLANNADADNYKTPPMGVPTIGSKIPAPDSPTGNERQTAWDKLCELEDDAVITMTMEETIQDMIDAEDFTTGKYADDSYLGETSEIEAALQRAWLEGDTVGGE